MLRKIVNMLMGASAAARAQEQTHFEALLERVRPRLKEALEPGDEALEVLATAIMREATGEPDINPQAARAFFSVLVENDNLPVAEQLDQHELQLLKNLLVEYFSGNNAVRNRANDVLALIEKKFSEGAFSQARILLQIFETDAETRLNNERNLFYEDMIMRLGMRRRHEVPENERDGVRELFGGLEISNDEDVEKALAWLGEEYYVHFCLAVRDPSELVTWQDFTQEIGGHAGRLLQYVPPTRWRQPVSIPGIETLALSELHMSDEAVEKHVQRLVKMCYFLLLASGDTGFESFVYSYLDWSREVLEVEAKNLLPIIHRRSVLDEVGLQDTLDHVFEEHYAEPLGRHVESSEISLEEAWNRFFQRMSGLDINEIPPGHYDVGGFLLDELLDFEQPEPYFGFKLYRLT